MPEQQRSREGREEEGETETRRGRSKGWRERKREAGHRGQINTHGQPRSNAWNTLFITYRRVRCFLSTPYPPPQASFRLCGQPVFTCSLEKTERGLKEILVQWRLCGGLPPIPTLSLSLLLFLLVRYFASPFKAWLNPPRSGEMSRLLPRWKATHESKGRKTERKGEKRMKKISSCVLYVDPTCSLSVQSSIYNRKGRRGSRTIRGALVDWFSAVPSRGF